MTELTDEQLLSMAAKALGYASIDPERGAEEGPGSFRQALEVFPEELIAFARTVLAAEAPAPVPVADGEREELAQWLDGEANDYDDLYPPESSLKLYRAAALLREPASAPAPEAGEAEELAQWLEFEADNAQELGCATIYDHDRLRWAAGYLRQLPPEGLSVEEYYHADSGARIVREFCDGEPGWCWTVSNSRHVNPCTEFPSLADAWKALQQARRREVGDE